MATAFLLAGLGGPAACQGQPVARAPGPQPLAYDPTGAARPDPVGGGLRVDAAPGQAGDTPAAGRADDSGPTSPMPPGRGPRPFPSTFVPLELSQFPRPAAEACSGRRTEVRVAPGQRIAHALAAARPGTTIWVEPGIYVEPSADGTALGWSTPGICLRAARGGAVVLQAAPGQRRGLVPEGDDTVIEGVTVRGFVAGVAFWTGGGRTQRRVTLEQLTVTAPAGALREGIVAYGDNRTQPGRPPTVDGLLLLDVRVEGTDLGISCNSGPCAHWWIERTRVDNRQGQESSGADALAVEEGRQIVVLDSRLAGAGADGIDLKAQDVLVAGVEVREVQRNGLKLWHGGDVFATVLDGTGGDAALVGGQPGRYRYQQLRVTRHGPPGATQYVGTWGYDHQEPGFRLELLDSRFFANARGGLFVPAGSQVTLRRCFFGDGTAWLLQLGADRRYRVADLEQLEADGLGQGNRIEDR